MLVLTRKVGECIVIGGDVVVKVLHVRGNRVSLGVDAPASTRVARGEVKAKPQVAVVLSTDANHGRTRNAA